MYDNRLPKGELDDLIGQVYRKGKGDGPLQQGALPHNVTLTLSPTPAKNRANFLRLQTFAKPPAPNYFTPEMAALASPEVPTAHNFSRLQTQAELDSMFHGIHALGATPREAKLREIAGTVR